MQLRYINGAICQKGGYLEGWVAEFVPATVGVGPTGVSQGDTWDAWPTVHQWCNRATSSVRFARKAGILKEGMFDLYQSRARSVKETLGTRDKPPKTVATVKRFTLSAHSPHRKSVWRV